MLTHIGTMQIKTERLLLRKFEYTDDKNMLKHWVSDPEIQLMYSEPVYTTMKEVKELLNKYISAYEKNDCYRWAIVLKETGECIGQIAYFLVDSNNHFAEIEYCIGSCFQRKGFATEATKSVIQYGFDKINLHKVQICHKSINIPSRNVIEKCGFVYEGTLRDFFYMDGQYVDRLYYSILKDKIRCKD
ncbi:GNAT family N-acetyltransferase [Clostridium estertheticum]|uniref:GNAT family N-acetyltransferase n=1 Tax=Clostridium estertheticum TaxID=238834 RepID=UPI001C0B776C|nr:GNAT family protein [Clostridium estertheticum]MBU3200146.1 GNAT family N-acetyltransferase [Clostridium estertheticum]WAG66316.1 GNAT family N-acetyltransferase [Clostridium estertheticum]